MYVCIYLSIHPGTVWTDDTWCPMQNLSPENQLRTTDVEFIYKHVDLFY